jgi:hypothetical protein
VQEQQVTPWDVNAGADGKIDYEKLIKKFGCQSITPELIERYVFQWGCLVNICEHL